MKTVFDWKKVSYARFWWEDGEGNKRSSKPKGPTLHGRDVDLNERLHPRSGELQGPLVVEVARERKALGEWTPQLKLQMSGNHALRFSGAKAIDLWSAWNARIFGGQHAS